MEQLIFVALSLMVIQIERVVRLHKQPTKDNRMDDNNYMYYIMTNAGAMLCIILSLWYDIFFK